MEFDFGLSLDELKKRTHKDYLKTITFLEPNDPAFTSLNTNDQKILAYLNKAGRIFDKIQMRLDNKLNVHFKEFLNREIAKKNEKAKLTKILFNAQKGMFSPDYEGNQIALVKNITEPFGLNFYPDNLDTEHFHEILNKMLDNKQYQEVANILSQRSVVRWNENDELVAIDYVDYFKEDFTQVATYLLSAASLCDRHEKKFAKFLKAQANALVTANPKLDAMADMLWAEITDSKFEFTITRECYDDRMSATVLENKELHQKLKNYNITVYYKDCLGARVGLVNKEGTELLKKLKNLNSISEKHMPHQDKYGTNKKSIVSDKQTAVDVDIVNLYGNEGEFRAGIVLAQNLPNNDKLSIKLGGGRKNVYHRQIRLSGDNKVAKTLLDKDLLKYYNKEADHLGTICHENTHSLGPDSNTLGKYSAIIEEFKADMGIYAFLHQFVAHEVFTYDQAKEIITTNIIDSFLKGKPNLTQAHRVRTVMILNRFFKEKAISLTTKNTIKIDFEKVIEASKIMLSELVELQLLGSVDAAEKYVIKYFNWSKELKTIADIKKKTSKLLNGKTEAPLAKHLEKIFG